MTPGGPGCSTMSTSMRHRSSAISRGLFECLACRAWTMRFIQHLLSDRMVNMDLDVDTWEIQLDETFAERDFPGVEVDRAEAWGVVGRVAGRGNGPSLMLNAHVDVVPPGDLLAWAGADPFSGRVTGNKVDGRGACDMKAGLVAPLSSVRGIYRAQGAFATSPVAMRI